MKADVLLNYAFYKQGIFSTVIFSEYEIYHPTIPHHTSRYKFSEELRINKTLLYMYAFLVYNFKYAFFLHTVHGASARAHRTSSQSPVIHFKCFGSS